ncbi:MAG: multidrug resistance protein family, partial [Acidobacteriota bacterium]|nr:multidrug resistance protein family [Acidobacteriota bacterium]
MARGFAHVMLGVHEEHGGAGVSRRIGLGVELSAVVRLALPVVAVQLGLMLMGVVDAMMLGRVSAQALAAGALGDSLSFSLLVGAMGILMAIDPLVSQAHGAEDREAIAAHLERGLVLALALAVPLSLLLWNARTFLSRLGEPAALVLGGTAFIRGSVPGVVPFLLFVVLRQTLQAMGIVRPAVVAMLVGNLVNFVGDYVLIFGHFGAPALGVAGSAYATSIGRWIMLMVLAFSSRKVLAPYFRGFTRQAFAWRAHGHHLQLGVPIGVHNSLELSVFAAVALLMGRLGVHELAGHQIALNLAAISYMVPAGVSAAASTRVGNAIGREDMPGARRAAVVCLLLGAGVMSLSGLLFALAPRFLAGLYSPDPGVLAMGAALIPVAAAFQVFDGVQVVGAGVLRGAADTRFAAIVALVGYWVLGLPLGAVFAFRFGHGPRGLWWGLTLGLAIVAVLLLARIVRRFRGHIARVGGV